MGIILDVVLLLILALCIFIGYKKGLVKVIFGLVAIVVSLIITVILYRPITNIIINNTQIDENISSAIEEKLTPKEENKSKENDKFLDKYITDAKNNIETGIVKSTSQIIAVNVVSISVGLILYTVVRIALTIVGRVTDVFTKLPIIKQFNKVGGTLYGALEGILIIYGILAVAFFIVTATNNIKFENFIDTSFITKFLYSNNIILNILF